MRRPPRVARLLERRLFHAVVAHALQRADGPHFCFLLPREFVYKPARFNLSSSNPHSPLRARVFLKGRYPYPVKLFPKDAKGNLPKTAQECDSLALSLSLSEEEEEDEIEPRERERERQFSKSLFIRWLLNPPLE